MTEKSKNLLTIAVCSNRIEKLRAHTLPLISEVIEYCRFQLFIDGSIKEDLSSLFTEINKIGDIEIITSNETRGHSNLRNLVLQSCKTKYLLYLDDDITITVNALNEIIETLENGFQIAGLKLVPADYIKIDKWYISPNQYHYIAVHTELTINSIWGACMAFSIEPIKQLNISFNDKLGRQNNKFLSGEDTTFIAHLTEKGYKSKVIQTSYAIHHIDKSRLEFLYLAKRVFWQGITEVVRNNINNGFSKELKRNFANPNLRIFFLGIIWMSIFSSGCFYGIWYKNFNK
ncbi:MAG: glycosyltransferase [Bacteroidetes bacterium]|nr:glycosyltransferase [Bacteroidota bacterium]